MYSRREREGKDQGRFPNRLGIEKLGIEHLYYLRGFAQLIEVVDIHTFCNAHDSPTLWIGSDLLDINATLTFMVICIHQVSQCFAGGSCLQKN